MDLSQPADRTVDRGHEDHERRQLLELLSVAVASSELDATHPDVARLLRLLSDAEATPERVAADWLRDALRNQG
jgi:hypothetical protein